MRTTLIIFIALALATTGCSISQSSGSISDSISSPSKSISDSSSGDDSTDADSAPAPETPQDNASYRRDVAQLTVTYLKSGGELSALRSAVTDLAKARGIMDWEADADTTQAIGVGAGNAGLQESAFEDFSKQLFGDDLAKLNELRKGYQQSAPAPAAKATDGAESDATATPDAS